MKFDRLKELRKKNHVSAKEIADLINLTNITYRSYEGGAREPKLASLIKMADFFGVSVDYLIKHSNYQYPIDDAKKERLDMDIKDTEIHLLKNFRALNKDMQDFIAASIELALKQQSEKECGDKDK